MDASVRTPGDRGRRDDSGVGSLIDGISGERSVGLEEISSLASVNEPRGGLLPVEVDAVGDERSKMTWVGLKAMYGRVGFRFSAETNIIVNAVPPEHCQLRGLTPSSAFTDPCCCLCLRVVLLRLTLLRHSSTSLVTRVSSSMLDSGSLSPPVARGGVLRGSSGCGLAGVGTGACRWRRRASRWAMYCSAQRSMLGAMWGSYMYWPGGEYIISRDIVGVRAMGTYLLE